MKADDIISKARKELVDFIIFELKMVFMYMYHGEEPTAGCDWIVTCDYLDTTPTIGVSVSDSEGNDYVSYRNLVEVRVDDNKNLTIVVENSVGVDEPIELTEQYLTTDELSYIADALEVTWNNMIGKK